MKPRLAAIAAVLAAAGAAAGASLYSTTVCGCLSPAQDLLGKRWSTQIVLALLDGKTRFSELKEAVAPISDTLLSERLKELEADGIIRRDVTPSTPVLIEYRLTDQGRDLERVMVELRSWAERWAEEPAPTP